MKPLVYRRLTTIMRILLITVMLFGQNYTWVNAQYIEYPIILGEGIKLSDYLQPKIINQSPAKILDTLPDDFLQFPLKTNQTIHFSGDIHTSNRWPGILSGIDMLSDTSTEVVAPAGGKIRNPSWCYLYIDFENGWAVRLVHIYKFKVSDGQSVKRNDTIAEIAPHTSPEGICYGMSTGDHVHMDLIHYGDSGFSPTAFAPLRGQVFSRWKIKYDDPTDNWVGGDAEDNSTIITNIDTQAVVGFDKAEQERYYREKKNIETTIETTFENSGVCSRSLKEVILYSESNYRCNNNNQAEGGMLVFLLLAQMF